jgi:hypothetical protein
MSKKSPLDLNIWEYQYVTLTLKGITNSIELENGDISTGPVTLNGLFINWDGETVHLNTIDDNPNVISASVLRSEIAVIEAYTLSDLPMESNGNSVN